MGRQHEIRIQIRARVVRGVEPAGVTGRQAARSARNPVGQQRRAQIRVRQPRLQQSLHGTE